MRFEYLAPATAAEAIDWLVRYGARARVLAGGTDLMCQIRSAAVQPDYVVDIEPALGPGYIRPEGDCLAISAMTAISALEKSKEIRRLFPVLSQAAGQLGSAAIRNAATAGGNLCGAVPSADMAPAFIALGASLRVTGPGGERDVPAADFFTGPRQTVLGAGEILREIRVPSAAAAARGRYVKHSVRGSIDLAIAGVAVTLNLDNGLCRTARIALGAVAPTPVRVRAAEKLLEGNRLDRALLEQAAEAAAAAARPVTDVRATAAYRRAMVKVITRQALESLAAGE